MILRNVLALITIILGASGFLYFIYYLSGPDERLQLPGDLDHLIRLRSVLEEYAAKRTAYTLLLFSSLYLYKQSFAIPGSVFLNLMSGALFGVVKGFPLCCLLSASGASSCFLLSKLFGKEILTRFAPRRVAYYRNLVDVSVREGRLFKFLISIRIFPMTPNWLINVCSPIVGVPLHSFFASALLGLAPYNFLTVNAGSALGDLNSLDEVFSWKMALGLGLLAIGILNPVKLFSKIRTKRKDSFLIPRNSDTAH